MTRVARGCVFFRDAALLTLARNYNQHQEDLLFLKVLSSSGRHILASNWLHFQLASHYVQRSSPAGLVTSACLAQSTLQICFFSQDMRHPRDIL